MEKVTKTKLRRAYERNAKMARDHLNAGQDLTELCQEYYGISLGDAIQEDDEIIDTLDYGVYHLPFDEFYKRMNKAKDELD